MAREGFPTTLATRELDKAKVSWTGHVFTYEEKGGTRHSSTQLGVDEHAVIKTLVFEDEDRKPLVVLMHGDCTVSVKELARQLGKRSIAPCAPEVAEKHTGYRVGGTSPFGTRKALRVYVEETVLTLPRVLVNGGQRGFLVAIEPSVFARVLQATPVRCALLKEP